MRAPAPRSMTPQEAAECAVSALGCGYDLTTDVRLSACKGGGAGSRLVRLRDAPAGDLILPGGVVVRDVPGPIRCDKGERTRFRSDVLSFHQMAEQFNHDLFLSGKIPSGLFNAMFDFRGCWHKDASTTKSLSFDGWFITLYSVELERTHVELHDHVKQDVPSSWDPVALAKFIEKYGTHIIVGIKMGGKDVIHIKQQHGSTLPPNQVQNLAKRLADESFSKDSKTNISDLEPARGSKSKHSASWECAPLLKPILSPVILKDSIVRVHVRRGGVDCGQSHSEWLLTIPEAPNVISMSFMPLVSILSGVQGSGFLSHAINLYLRYKPRMEELHHFLEFQIPRKWAPVFGDLPLSLQRDKHRFPSLQFTLMGPKLSVNPIPVESGNRPVTGVRLYLEGKKSDCLAVHLQHLSELPEILHLSGDSFHNDISPEKSYYEPIRWSFLSHVCTAPVQYTGSGIDELAYIVTKAWLDVREINMRKVLFLRLGFSAVASAKIRNSQWGGPAGTSRKSGSISGLLSTRFSTGQVPPAEPPRVDLNSAVFPAGPPAPAKAPKMSSFVDTTEMAMGPEEPPGYWVVTGAKLCVEGGKISLRVKYSLLTLLADDDMSGDSPGGSASFY